MRASPFVSFDERAVIGALKATGSKDPDVLYVARGKLIGAASVPRLVGGALLVSGLAVSAAQLQLGIAVGVGLLLIGWWFLHRGNRNVRMVEKGYAQYTGSFRR